MNEADAERLREAISAAFAEVRAQTAAGFARIAEAARPEARREAALDLDRQTLGMTNGRSYVRPWLLGEDADRLDRIARHTPEGFAPLVLVRSHDAGERRCRVLFFWSEVKLAEEGLPSVAEAEAWLAAAGTVDLGQ